MSKTICIISLFISLCTKGNTGLVFSDSTGKDELKNLRSNKTVRLKQSLVRTAIIEFAKWRSDSTRREDNDFGVYKVKLYWRSVGKQVSENNLRDSLWQEHHPWSSAFISWVITKAGAASKFKPSPNHAGYIVWARQNQRPVINKDVFVAYDICNANSRWPEPGDIICKNRDGNKFTLATITSSDISHSDIVVEVDTVARTITTIGGNLNNTVSKRIIQLDQDGYINRTANWKLLDAEKGDPEGAQSEFFAVIKLQTATVKSRRN
jgi:hypothetical protein